MYMYIRSKCTTGYASVEAVMLTLLRQSAADGLYVLGEDNIYDRLIDMEKSLSTLSYLYPLGIQ